MDSKNEVKKEKKNILKKIYYVLTYGISLSLIVYSIINEIWVFYSAILLPLLSVVLFLYNLSIISNWCHLFADYYTCGSTY